MRAASLNHHQFSGSGAGSIAKKAIHCFSHDVYLVYDLSDIEFPLKWTIFVAVAMERQSMHSDSPCLVACRHDPAKR